MTPERHRQIGELYHRARALPPAERAALLSEACGGDSELVAEVGSLLGAHDSAGSFLDESAIEVAARLLRDDPQPTPTHIGRYQLVSLIGRGGMGDVYLADDPVLGRQVAIKLLATPLTPDALAVGRFEQEARAASSLNHPNIVTIHDIGAADDGRYIAMEFVEGQPLSASIGQPMPAATLLPLARQVAQALAVAHAAGIVHRDVKPENLMVRHDGYVKLLDFGVARLLAPRAHGDVAEARLPTQAGLLIGTPRYMAPEQIRGEPATTASDVFALGAVLHELATGKHPSEHGSIARRLSGGSSSGQEAQGAADLPPGLAELVRRMLDPDPLARPGAAEVESSIRALERQLAPSPLRRIRRPAAAIAAIAVGALAAAGALKLVMNRTGDGGRPPVASRIQFEVVPAANTTFSPSAASLALSPDGRWLAYTASSETQQGMALWIKAWDTPEPRRIASVPWAGQIFWSPDSRSVAFADETLRLNTVDIANGTVRSMSDVRLVGSGVGAWSPRHGIVVRTTDPGLQQVPLDGGPRRAASTLDAARQETAHSFPAFLPDGEHFVYLASSSDPAHDSVAYLTAPGSTERKRLFKSDSQVIYADPGYLLYMLGFTLVAQPFDATTRQVTGGPRAIAEQVERNSGSRRGAFTVSDSGVLAYRQHSETQLRWYQRDGRRLQTLGPRGHYRNPALSPDGKTMAVARLDVKAGAWDIWTIDIERNAAVPLVDEPSGEDMPVWSPEGTSIAFTSDRGRHSPGTRNGVYSRAATGAGSARVLIDKLSPIALHAWTSDGLVYSRHNVEATEHDFDLWRLPIGAEPHPEPIELLATPSWEMYCKPSPDGRWMAYVSDHSGRPEVYVARYPSADGKTLISVAGGSEPAWRGDGQELFYLSPDRRVMAVPIKTRPILAAGRPIALFEAGVSPLINSVYTRNQYVVSADGQRFLINEPLGKTALSVISVVFNWATAFGSESGS